MKRRLLFRVDANKTIGRGHLSRCIAIAEMLENDFEILFVSHIDNRSYMKNIAIPYQFKSVTLDINFFDFINKNDIVWLDGYSFTEEFKMQLRSRVYKLVETNDIPYKVENVDILFNHTPGAQHEWFDVRDEKTTLYLGLQYVLLRDAFLEKARDYEAPSNLKGVFICFGGADNLDLGWRFVERLVQNGFQDPIFWICSENKPEVPALAKNVHLKWGLSQHEMIDYMNKCKVMLISSSVLSFEAVALRRPVYTGYFIDNQELIAKGLKEEKLALGCENLGVNEIFETAVHEFLDFYKDRAKQRELVKNQQKSIDGYSGLRIANIINSI